MKSILTVSAYATIWFVIGIQAIVVAFLRSEDSSILFWVLLSLGTVCVFRAFVGLVSHLENKSRSS